MGQLIVFINIIVPILVATVAPVFYERHVADVRPVYDVISGNLGPPGSRYHLTAIAVLLLIIFRSPIIKVIRKTCWLMAIFAAPLFFNPELREKRRRLLIKHKFGQTTLKLRKTDHGQLVHARKALQKTRKIKRMLVSRAKKMIQKFITKERETLGYIVDTKKMTEGAIERSAHAWRKFLLLSYFNKELERLVDYKTLLNARSVAIYTNLYKEMARRFDRGDTLDGLYLSEIKSTSTRDLEHWDQTFSTMEERYTAILNSPEIQHGLA